MVGNISVTACSIQRLSFGSGLAGLANKVDSLRIFMRQTQCCIVGPQVIHGVHRGGQLLPEP